MDSFGNLVKEVELSTVLVVVLLVAVDGAAANNILDSGNSSGDLVTEYHFEEGAVNTG